MSQKLVFTDVHFEYAIRQKLGIPDRPITDEDALSIAELDCGDFDFLEDAGILRFFPNLTSLALESHVRVLPTLRYLPKLENLDIVLWGGGEIDLSHLSQLKRLQRLFVSRGDISSMDIVNTASLIELPVLRSLSFHEFGRIDLKFLERMPELEEFMCGWANEVINFDSIQNLKKLKSLRLVALKNHDVDFSGGFSGRLP